MVQPTSSPAESAKKSQTELENDLAEWYADIKKMEESLLEQLRLFYSACYEDSKRFNAQRIAAKANVKLNTVYKWVERGKRIVNKEE